MSAASTPSNAATPPATDHDQLRGFTSIARHHEAWRRRLIRLRADLALTDESASLDGIVHGPFAAAVQRETIRRMDRFLEGVQLYRRHPARRDFGEPDTVMEDGGSRLLDFRKFSDGATAGGPSANSTALLMIPSLVNRWQVLDITAERSFMRAMARAGIGSYLVDWSTPTGAERDFSATDYVLRLERMLDFLRRQGFTSIHIGGYCMGGLLALALAIRRQRDIASLLLLATPWDFHADRTGQALMMANLPFLSRLVAQAGELPVDALQTLFYSLDPWQVVRKFTRFAGLDQNSPAAREFVLLEDWLNEGAALPGPLALDCLLGWYGANTPAMGQWEIAGEKILPQQLLKPVLTIVPGQDRIVPPASARALAPGSPIAPPQAKGLELALGHIGMVVSGRAPQMLWQPITDWLHGSR
ncbi:MAG: phaC [Alphaproteobacteria bacterium]|nr:phaC [Alphaproteobacteria bacterium]